MIMNIGEVLPILNLECESYCLMSFRFVSILLLCYKSPKVCTIDVPTSVYVVVWLCFACRQILIS